jgi:hypothetical protein
VQVKNVDLEEGMLHLKSAGLLAEMLRVQNADFAVRSR